MSLDIINKLPLKYQRYNISKIESGASSKKIYRLYKDNESIILTNFDSDSNEYDNHLLIYNILKEVNVSIPKIIEKNDSNLTIISEDFGDLRYDKVFNKYPVQQLLLHAVDTLIILKKSIKFNLKYSLPQYNFHLFKSEIQELTKYYFPYIKKFDKDLIEEFIFIWSEAYNQINTEFVNFVHKDFNINNLIYLPKKSDYLKCGFIDFQSSFWGESSWDLFSLLEDSRILFTDKHNDYFIEYFYNNTNQNISIKEFKLKYYFFNSSRQSRLLGRWIYLSNKLNENWYLDFIPITKKRLKKSLINLDNKNLNSFYNRHIFSK